VQLLFQVLDLRHALVEHLRIDCVPGHATPVIDVYPRGPASGQLPGFRLAPSGPPRAKVLRAGQAVIAWHAYESIVHGVLILKGCLRRCPGAVPPGLRLIMARSHPGHTAPRTVLLMRAGVAGLADPLSFLPVVALLLLLRWRSCASSLADCTWIDWCA
jgi:hypothetical protein